MTLPPTRAASSPPIALLAALALAGCDYEAPINDLAPEALNAITGEVIAPDVSFPQPTVLFLADAANPMPPSGTGSPISFGTIPGNAFTSAPGGLRAASFALPNVPDGTFLLTAFMDMDRNFHPAVGTLAGATCGDLVGAHLAGLSGSTPAPLTVAGGELVSDIAVVLGVTLPFERPAFTVTAGSVALSNPATWGLRLDVVGIDASYGPEISLTLDGPGDATNPADFAACKTLFWRHFRDLDADGAIDPHPDYPPELGLLDAWPRIYLEWLGAPVDADDDGTIDAFDRGDVDGRVISEALPYTPCGPAPCAPPEAVVVGQPFPASDLTAIFTGQALAIAADGTRSPTASPPTGAWKVTVILETGQTWSVPNELGPVAALRAVVPPPGVTSDADLSQGTWLSVAE